jgi:hypothetical protein
MTGLAEDPDVCHLDALARDPGIALGRLTQDQELSEPQRNRRTYLLAHNFRCVEAMSKDGYTHKVLRKPQLFGEAPWLTYDAWIAATSNDASQMLASVKAKFEAVLGRDLDRAGEEDHHLFAQQEVFSAEYESGETRRMLVLLRHRFILAQIVTSNIPIKNVWEIVHDLGLETQGLMVVNNGTQGIVHAYLPAERRR